MSWENKSRRYHTDWEMWLVKWAKHCMEIGSKVLSPHSLVYADIFYSLWWILWSKIIMITLYIRSSPPLLYNGNDSSLCIEVKFNMSQQARWVTGDGDGICKDLVLPCSFLSWRGAGCARKNRHNFTNVVTWPLALLCAGSERPEHLLQRSSAKGSEEERCYAVGTGVHCPHRIDR